MQIAAIRSGLSPHVIRVWERRYGAVRPERSTGSRRLYSDKEIERLALLGAATRAGHAIGTIAQLDVEQLGSLLAKTQAVKRAEPARTLETGGIFRGQCLEAVKRLDAGALDQALQSGLVALGHQGFLQAVVSPLAEEIGAQWHEGAMTSAHEHFFTAAAKVFLGQLSKQFAPGSAAPSLVVGTPAGQLHELGAFMAGAAATHLGWRVAYLGAGLPAAEIAGAARQCGAAVVALSIIYPEDDPQLPEELLSLRRYLPFTRLIVGGRAAAAYGETLVRIGASVVASLDECCEVLTKIRGERRTGSPPPAA